MSKDKNFNVRNAVVFVFEILLIVISIGGLTFAATSLMDSSSNTEITFGEYNVDYIGKTEVVATGLEPMSDSLVDYNTSSNVIRLEFSLRGVELNKDDKLIYDVMLKDLNIDCSLLNEYTKWNLYKNQELLYSGSFDPKFDGNILTDNMRLTETQQDLPSYNSDYDKYVLIIWISESCDDLTSCNRVDQSNVVNSNLSMTMFIAISTGNKIQYKRVPNLDSTCVNRPVLYNGMVPAYYDNGEWKIANKTNSDANRLWYSYGDARWANALVLNTSEYNESRPGTVIASEDILAHYVWIPRFKYKLWNSEDGLADSYDAYNKGIDIVFESGVNSSGTVKCVDDRCLASNGKYLTHPAFSNNLRGFWISKYELSEGNKFVSNKNALTNKTVDEYKDIINNLNTTYNLGNDVSSHIITNMEWGATLYLSHSKYGVCKDNKCNIISSNNTLVSESNKQDTTTRNVYGVYDMAGGSSEYVLGSTGLGSALTEVRINDNATWYNGYYVNSGKEYTVRGGIENGLFYAGDIGMYDVSTRGVLINK